MWPHGGSFAAGRHVAAGCTSRCADAGDRGIDCIFTTAGSATATATAAAAAAAAAAATATIVSVGGVVIGGAGDAVGGDERPKRAVQNLVFRSSEATASRLADGGADPSITTHAHATAAAVAAATVVAAAAVGGELDSLTSATSLLTSRRWTRGQVAVAADDATATAVTAYVDFTLLCCQLYFR